MYVLQFWKMLSSVEADGIELPQGERKWTSASQ